MNMLFAPRAKGIWKEKLEEHYIEQHSRVSRERYLTRNTYEQNYIGKKVICAKGILTKFTKKIASKLDPLIHCSEFGPNNYFIKPFFWGGFFKPLSGIIIIITIITTIVTETIKHL